MAPGKDDKGARAKANRGGLERTGSKMTASDDIEQKQMRAREHLYDITTRLNDIFQEFVAAKQEMSVIIPEENIQYGTHQAILKELTDARHAINSVSDKKLKFQLTTFLADYKKILVQNRDPERAKIVEDLEEYFSLGQDAYVQMEEENEEMRKSRETVEETLAALHLLKSQILDKSAEGPPPEEASTSIATDSMSWNDAWKEMGTIFDSKEFKSKAGSMGKNVEALSKVLVESLKKKEKETAMRRQSVTLPKPMELKKTTAMDPKDLLDLCTKLKDMSVPLAKQIQTMQQKESSQAKYISDKGNKLRNLGIQFSKVKDSADKTVDLDTIPVDESEGEQLQLLKAAAQVALDDMAGLESELVKLQGMMTKMADDSIAKESAGAMDRGIGKELLKVMEIPKAVDQYEDHIKKSVSRLEKGQAELARSTNSVSTQALEMVVLDIKILAIEEKLNTIKLMLRGVFTPG